MGFAFKRRIYEALPPVVKRPVAWIPFSFFAGKAYRKTIARGPWVRGASVEELHAYQARELGKTLAFAAAEVPAYESLRGTVERLSPFEALKAFPLINKRLLQEDIQRFLPKNFTDIPHFEVSTGGTSRASLRVREKLRSNRRSRRSMEAGVSDRRDGGSDFADRSDYAWGHFRACHPLSVFPNSPRPIGVAADGDRALQRTRPCQFDRGLREEGWQRAGDRDSAGRRYPPDREGEVSSSHPEDSR